MFKGLNKKVLLLVETKKTLSLCICKILSNSPDIQIDVPGLSRGKVRPGRAADHSPSTSAAVMEE